MEGRGDERERERKETRENREEVMIKKPTGDNKDGRGKM
jgi:hypothetical protein